MSGEATGQGFQGIRDKVKGEGGAICVPMSELRVAEGAGRLGPWVIRSIQNGLHKEGLNFSPVGLSTNQDDLVLIYQQGTAIAKIVGAVERPSHDGAKALCAVTQEEDAQILSQIRALVCE